MLTTVTCCLSIMCIIFNIGSSLQPTNSNISNFNNNNLGEGSSCEHGDLTGICKIPSNCSTDLRALKDPKLHNFPPCGIIGRKEVVCCLEVLAEKTIKGRSKLQPLTNREKDETSELNEMVTGLEESSRNQSTRRKCETMCEKVLIENGIQTGMQFNVLNGRPAKEFQFPHMAALGFRDENDTLDWRRCGATLISSRFLLTAAHCDDCAGCSDPIKARFGVVDIRNEKSAQDVDVSEVIIAPGHEIVSRHSDIAIVKLARDAIINEKVYPACLYSKEDDPPGLMISGWGQTDAVRAESRSNVLQWALVEAIPIDKCNTTLLSRFKNTKKTIIWSQICITSKSRSDTCAGDSGGPLQTGRKQGGFDLVGISSYGVSCGTSVPAIYTRVSAYLDWIEEIVWPS